VAASSGSGTPTRGGVTRVPNALPEVFAARVRRTERLISGNAVISHSPILFTAYVASSRVNWEPYELDS
jgi:hypothetical protein